MGWTPRGEPLGVVNQLTLHVRVVRRGERLVVLDVEVVELLDGRVGDLGVALKHSPKPGGAGTLGTQSNETHRLRFYTDSGASGSSWRGPRSVGPRVGDLGPACSRWMSHVSVTAVLASLRSSVLGCSLALSLAPVASNAGPAKSAAPAPEAAEYRTALAEGDRAFLGKRFDEAVSAYEKAIAKQPASAEAYGRLAAAQRELGKLDEAIATLGQGLDKGTDVTERAKLLFLQADIRERQRALPEATDRWSAYLDTASGGEVTIDLDAPEAAAESTAVPGAKVYPATAHERLKQVAAAEKRQKDYASVKDRIKKREQQAEAKARSAR